MTRRQIAVAVTCSVLVAAGLIGAAVARSGGAAGSVEFKTGGAFSTPTGTFLPLTTDTFASGAGPIVVRLSAVGYVQDTNSGGGFVGKSYAALRVRVLVNGALLPPGVITLMDNTGKISISAPRPVAASYEWAGNAAGGATTVRVEVANLHTFDNTQINHWTLSIQHG